MGHCQLFVVDGRSTGGSEVRARTGGREKRSVLGRAAIDGRGDGPGNRDGAGGEGPGTPGSRRPRRRQRPRTRCCRAAPSTPPQHGRADGTRAATCTAKRATEAKILEGEDDLPRGAGAQVRDGGGAEVVNVDLLSHYTISNQQSFENPKST